MTTHPALEQRAKEIPLTRGLVALVDADDFERLNNMKWYACGKNGLFYASRMIQIGSKRRQVQMHRSIIMLPSCSQVDHRNGNSLDNRKENLRPCTPSQNQANQRIYSIPKTSRYKGVRWDSHNSKWTAQIGMNGKTKHIGMFADEVSAAKAYDVRARQIHGEYARCNFPLEVSSGV